MNLVACTNGHFAVDQRAPFPALLIGGGGTEHDASLAGYVNIHDNLLKAVDRRQFDVLVYIDRDNDPHLLAQLGAEWPRTETELRALPAVSWSEAAAALARRFTFSLVHGAPGEDGTLQGWAETHRLSTSLGPVQPSSTTMMKWVAGPTVAALVDRITIPATYVVTRATKSRDLDLAGAFAADRPVVVKPGGLGASLFTTSHQQWNRETIAAEVDQILHFDTKALIQEQIQGTEYSVGVLDTSVGAEALPPMRIRTTHGFFDHDAKHRAGLATTEFAPGGPLTDALKSISEEIFTKLDMFGWARVDFLVTDNGKVYFLEVNDVPGMMQGSMFPLMLAASGRAFVDLLRLLQDADARRDRPERTFEYQIEAH